MNPNGYSDYNLGEPTDSEIETKFLENLDKNNVEREGIPALFLRKMYPEVWSHAKNLLALAGMLNGINKDDFKMFEYAAHRSFN
jgi:hypothetical protein